MPDDHDMSLDPTQLLFKLQNIDSLNQSLSGCRQPEEIAQRITAGLIAKFNCAFARIWLVEKNRASLRLVASSGLYTRLDGDFSTVPMGAYKVGKIAQHCIPFLSNQLANESWVKDPDWAIDNNICGFAGLPLAIAGKTVGVLAVFSNQPMETEFLEALSFLCSSLAVAINNAQLNQAELKALSNTYQPRISSNIPLSEQISSILPDVRLTLLGTERSLSTFATYILLKTTETLRARNCSYCRLTYNSKEVYLEAIFISELNLQQDGTFQDINSLIGDAGGELRIELSANNIAQIKISLPYEKTPKIQVDLSNREQEVVQLLAEGLRDREIAKKLFISDRTVKFHINNAVAKLKARTRIQAIHLAYSQGLLSSIFTN
ncbi:MAG: LuxR C-terminal-related transcriptional regulator [Cyanobacteria bacterium J06643_13]